MPPSPSIRCSPREQLRTHHKKGRSLESGLSFKEKDDDLALFNEVQSKEQDNFLLQSTDDLEDMLSTKFKSLPDLNLGIMIPTRGESSDLLNVDEEKNDYEWLLTPPDTPLFPSLDDEQIPVNLVHDGRPRSRAISISRSSIKSYSSRGSASPQRLSPQRLSPSPRSCGSSTFQSRGRPSSAARSSPTPSSRHSTPTRRSSPLPGKPSAPPRRSSTPTPRRLSTGSSAAFPSGVSPVRSSRGSSSSPKIRAWQSDIPGFSLEAPPNLCTSLANRPSSYVRGSSPASRNSRNSSSTVRRQSMSPTAVRSISSLHRHERDSLHSYSKGSVDSSGTDDTASFLSVPVDGSGHSLYRRGVGGLSSNRPMSFFNKPSKVSTPSSAPKRSFDTAIRHMDRKSPQNMFRPLLSSLPSTTFYGGDASSSHCTMASMNSSITASSNASSDQATSGAPDTEGSEHNPYDMASESGKALNANDEIFSFDKTDAAGEDTLETHDQLPDIQFGESHKASAFEPKRGGDKEFNHYNGAGIVVYAGEGYAQAESHIDTSGCSKCGCIYNVTELVEDEVNLCPKCKVKDGIMVKSITSRRLDVPHNSLDPTTKISKEVGSSNASVPYLATPQSSEVMETSKSVMDPHSSPGEDNERESTTTNQGLSQGSCLDNPSAVSEDKANAHMLSDMQLTGHVNIPDTSSVGIDGLRKCNDVPPSKIDVAEGAGISVLLLKRSSSSKGPVIQSRGFAASSVSYDVRSYARESTSSMRSSAGHGSVSTSSSIDMSSTHMLQQLSGRVSENALNPESVRSFSQTSSHISQGLGLAAIAREENFDARVSNESPVNMEEPETSFEPAVGLENIQRMDGGDCFSQLTLVEEKIFCRSTGSDDIPVLESVVDVLSNQSENGSVPLLAVDKEQKLDAIDDHLPKKVACGKSEESASTPESCLTDESRAPNNDVDIPEFREDPHNDLEEMSEIEIDDCHIGSPASNNDVVSRDAIQEPSALPHEHKDASSSASKSNELEIAPSVLEESKVMVEDHEGRKTRSLTLEEAADTILFCSSIVHSLAYEAASIAMKKEKENLIPLESLRPAVTTVGRPSSERDPHFRSITKRTPKAHKGRRRGEEVETNVHCSKMEAEDDYKPTESAIRNVGIPHNMESSKPPKLESKCNCTIM